MARLSPVFARTFRPGVVHCAAGRSGHAGDVEVLDRDGRPLCGQRLGEGVQGRCAAFGDFVVPAADESSCSAAAVRAFLGARECSLRLRETGPCGVQVPRVVDRLTSG